jgi:hypothetical protein
MEHEGRIWPSRLDDNVGRTRRLETSVSTTTLQQLETSAMLVSTMLGQLGDSTGIIVEPMIDVGTTRDRRRLETSTVLISTNARDTR